MREKGLGKTGSVGFYRWSEYIAIYSDFYMNQKGGTIKGKCEENSLVNSNKFFLILSHFS